MQFSVIIRFINCLLFFVAKKFVRLTSIDIICDHPDNYEQWIEGVSCFACLTLMILI